MPSVRVILRQLDRDRLLSVRLIGVVAVAFVVLLATQMAVGAAFASPPSAGEVQQTPAASDGGDGAYLPHLGSETTSNKLAENADYSITNDEFESELSDHGFGRYTTSDSVSYEIIPSESTVETISSHAEDVSPPAILTLLGYSRYDSSDPLENEIRAELHDQIHSDAGLSLTELISTIDVSESTVRYHTRILEEEALVEKVDLWGNVRLFPARYGPQQQALTVALDDTALKSVLSAVETHEPATVSAVADEIDRAPSTVSHHLSRLEAAELVERERDGKRVVTRLKPAVQHALHAGTVAGETPARSVSD